MKRNFDECFKHLGDTDESAAECIHCLKKNGEQVIFDTEKKRLKLGRELFDEKYVEYMETITKLLEIESVEDYEKADKKFNLTMY